MAPRNDDPAHIAAVARVAEKRGCDWPGHPCGRDIPEFNGRDAECLCETIASRKRRPLRWVDWWVVGMLFLWLGVPLILHFAGLAFP